MLMTKIVILSPMMNHNAVPLVDEVVLKEHEFKRFQALFYEKLGIHLPDHKIVLVGTRLRKRLRAHHLHSYSEYYELIHRADQQEELGRALELITTNETYFFREPVHFEFLSAQILPERHEQTEFSVWSAACSSGEELYSIAMVLADRCQRKWNLLGSDINQSMLDKTKQAIYSDERTEHLPASYRKRFCRRGVGPYQGYLRIEPELRSRIKLQRIELHKPLPDIGKFDVVFLRNVMIYFNADTRAATVESIVRTLKPGGYLFVGHSENLRGITDRLERIQPAIYRLRVS